MSRCILFLGTPRSGTSCGAGILHRLGLPMGERFLPPDDWNPAGYYQDSEFEQIIVRALAELSLDDEVDWFPEWPLPEGSATEARKQIRALAEQRSDKHEAWGVKSNRLIYFLEDLQAAAEVVVITTSRLRDNSVASWKDRSGDSDKRSAEVVDRMNNGIESALKKAGITPSLTIPYDELISSPAEWVGRIAEIAGLPVSDEAVEWVNPKLRRFV